MNDFLAFLKDNAVSAAIVAAITGLFGYLGVRRQSARDQQTSLNEGFDGVVKHSVTLLEQARQEMADLRADLARKTVLIDRYGETFDAMHEIILSLYDDRTKLQQVIIKAGLELPPLASLASVPHFERPEEAVKG